MDKTAWIDRGYNRYAMDGITDKHLINILRFIGNDGGHKDFVTEEVVKALIAEAFNRNLIVNP